MWFYEHLYPDIRIAVKGNLVYRERTPYQKLELYQTPRYGKMLVLDGTIQTTEKDEFIYHEMLTHPVLLLHPKPKKVLIIGGGDGGALREVLKHNIKEVYLVEIDRNVIEISQKYLKKICQDSFSDKRLHLIIDDGARFIRKTSEKFDIVIVDSPDPIGPAKVLFSKNFYSQIYSILTEYGIMVRQSGSTILQQDELKTNYKLLKKIFTFATIQIASIPTYIGGFFSFLIAFKKINSKTLNIEYIEKKFKTLGLKTHYYNPEVQISSMCLPTYISRIAQ